MNIEELRAEFEAWWDGLPASMQSLLTYEVATQAYDLGRAALTAQPSVPEGWKLVPVEPTEEMSAAGWDHIDITAGQCQDGPKDVYRAMLAAAPTPPAGRAVLQSKDREGWKEAAIAWEVCASLHRDYAKGRDPLFKTRQSDFVKHAKDSRLKALSPCSTEDKTDAERYRWLRDSALLFSQIEQRGVSGWMVGRRDHVKARFYTYNGKELDEAIDHARRVEAGA